MIWLAITLLLATLVGARVLWLDDLEPSRPSAPPLHPGRRCHSCLQWQGGPLDGTAYCGHTKKIEERHDGCSRWVARADR